MKIIRVFPRQTKATPRDDYAFVGEPVLDGWLPEADEVHVSVTFTWDREQGERLKREWEVYYPGKVKIGGPAYDDPGGEFVPGRYLKEGYVITSRGCPASCEFCFVPKREGKLRLLEIKDGYNILDNNILATPRDHFVKVIKMLERQKKAAMFTGGLDAAYLKYWHIELLCSIRVKRLYLAYDNFSSANLVMNAARHLTEAGFNREKLFCYVLIGFNGEDITKAKKRLEQVWNWGMMPFAMLYSNARGGGREDRRWVDLQAQYCQPGVIKALHKHEKVVM